MKVAVNKGVAAAMIQNQVFSENLKISDAYKQFGRTSVDRWIKEGLVSLHATNGKRKTVKRDELKKIAASSNRTTYLNVKERH